MRSYVITRRALYARHALCNSPGRSVYLHLYPIRLFGHPEEHIYPDLVSRRQEVSPRFGS